MNITTKIPPRLRFALYIGYGLGSLVMAYLARKGTVGPDEVWLWTGLGALFGWTAASNVGREPGLFVLEEPEDFDAD